MATVSSQECFRLPSTERAPALPGDARSDMPSILYFLLQGYLAHKKTPTSLGPP
jgi:hypothetical protein